MKATIAALMFLFSITANANAEFKLKFSDPTQIEYNANDWELISVEGTYDFYIAKNSINDKGMVKMHSLVDYHKIQENSNSPIMSSVKKIYSFGMIDCTNGILYLLNDFFTTETNQVVYIQNHDFGEYRVELLTPNTPRNKVYIRVCNKDA
jgi:hypothetical protein